MILITQQVSVEGPGLISDFFADVTWQIKIVDFEKGDTLPHGVSEIEALIVLGGPMNVYEEKKYPFLKKEHKLIQDALKQEIPILGICLGAQLLAKACAAPVKKSLHEEIGWHKIDLTNEGKKDPIFQGISHTLEVFQWHGDTFSLPKGASLLATSTLCTNQAFRMGKCAYGFQFHIEVTPKMVETWIKEYFDAVNSATVITTQKMHIDTFKKHEYLSKIAAKIFLNFSKLIRKKHELLDKFFKPIA